MPRTELDAAIERMRFARSMTLGLLEGLTPEQWRWRPEPQAGGGTMNPIVWHAGHLAFAQYFLCVVRQRGRQEEDRPLISTAFLKRHKQGSLPSEEPGGYDSPDEVLRVMRGVMELAIATLAPLDDALLGVPSPPDHPVFATKLGAVQWCSQHELMHAGQITLLRRLQGFAPRW